MSDTHRHRIEARPAREGREPVAQAPAPRSRAEAQADAERLESLISFYKATLAAS
jgi:hypothetical protein